MRDLDIIAIIAFIVISIAALKLLGDPRFRPVEQFQNPEKADPVGTQSKTALSPDVKEDGPAHILKDKIPITRPYNTFGTLTQQKCYEQDGHRVPEKLGSYAQRTNNYKHTYPDSCSAPFKELVGSFYAPREGSIGAPIPVGSPLPRNLDCAYGQA